MENPNVPNTLLLGVLEVDFSEIDGAAEESDVCVSRGDFKPPSSPEVSELWDRCDLVLPLPHNIPIQLWEVFAEVCEADGGKSSSFPGTSIDEESSPSEEESARGELNCLGMGLTVASLLWEINCDAEGVTSSSGIFADNCTSSERASDNDSAMDKLL